MGGEGRGEEGRGEEGRGGERRGGREEGGREEGGDGGREGRDLSRVINAFDLPKID